MKESKPLAKDLCFVVRLDPQSLSCVERSETFLQFAQNIFAHGITSSEIGSIFRGASGSARHYRRAPCGKMGCLHNEWLHAPPAPPGGKNGPSPAKSTRGNRPATTPALSP